MPTAVAEIHPIRPRLPYQPPRLVDLGDLRDVTLGASPGIGDSGGTQPQRCPGCP
ncbi:MAG: lasso RiPP family leader peptide-containing protein [Lysobacterales bacterium]